ncbi:hypothetical protein MNBD_PLANCTO03-264 [hydrothermal vent metagenome]|uniref:Uncharacterized protein n=1 Tax=hydrothermal vent metagenome TaxID=652676 RepID=A0A3B1DQA0_9ZZZZ
MPRLVSIGIAAALPALCLLSAPVLAQDWVIGYDDPNEIVILSVDRTVNGNIILLNNGSLRVEPGVTLGVTDQVILTADSDLQLTGATLRFIQSFAYQGGIQTSEQASFVATDSVLRGSGHGFTLGLVGNSHIDFSGVETINGFPTWGLFESSTATVRGSTLAGEFLCFGDNQLDIADSEFVLLWLTTPAGSAIDTTLPPQGDVGSFSIGPDSDWATGIPYTATLTNCTEVYWALMARSGSSATFRNSRLRVAGSYFERNNQIEVVGLANNTHLSDQAFNWGDISLRFIDSDIDTWNFYSFGSTQLTIDSCVFGELLAGETGQATILNSLCDGSGGYMGASDQSILVMFNSVNLSQTTTTGQSGMYAIESALLGDAIDAIDESVMFLYNTEHSGSPAAADAGAIFDTAIESVEGFTDEPLSVRGSARLIHGPSSPWQFIDYSVEFGPGYEPEEWTPIVSGITDEVFESELAPWDASGLAEGNYSLRLTVTNNLAEPLVVQAGAVLWERCMADFNRDGVVNTLDVIDFFDAWAIGDPSADLNGDGSVDTRDVLTYLNAWTVGC